jgi:hypothetical protein
LCAVAVLAVLVGVISTGPVVEMGTNDDWSYVQTALTLARTGRLQYNGWGAPFLGLQAVWGAAAIHIFGFSFTVLRLSMLPFAMGCSAVLFLLSRRLGLNRGLALLVALTACLSPLFIPLAASFMTDVPADFFMLLSVFGFVRAVQSDSQRSYLGYLTTATVAGIAGGTVRQIGCLPVLILLPALVLASPRRRSNRTIVACATGLWLLTTLAVIVCMAWQKRQPYHVSFDMVGNTRLVFTNPLRSAQTFLSMLQGTALFMLPVGLVFIGACIRRSNLRRVGIVLLLAFLVMLAAWRGVGVPPLIGNMFTEYGVLYSGVEALGIKPVVLPRVVQKCLLATVYVMFAFVILGARQGDSPLAGFVKAVRARNWEEHPAFLVFVPFSITYAGTVLLFTNSVFDRYVLPLVPLLAIGLLLVCRLEVTTKTLAAGFVGLLAFAAFGIAATHDYLAAARARLTAAQQIENSGVPRTSISAGLEYDAWTQMERSRHVDFLAPVEGYRFQLPGLRTEHYWFWDYTPDVRPTYFVVYSEQPGLIMAKFPRVPFTAWLPPFRREVLVETLPPVETSPMAMTAQ